MTVNPEDFPSIQASAILAGNAYPTMGYAKNIPDVAELLVAQGTSVERAKIALEAQRTILEGLEQVVNREERAQRNVSLYLNGLVTQTAREAARES